MTAPTRPAPGDAREASSPAALRVDGREVAEAEFYAIACDPRRSVVVEACAGAGKTWMLVSRLLRALVDGAAPHELLAITFTRKAAAEVRGRLEEWLVAFSDLRSTPGDRVKALVERGLSPTEARHAEPALGALRERLLRDGRRVEVRTFHGWFGQLVRQAPWALLAEAGLPPEPEFFERFDDHRREVMRRFHGRVRRDSVLAADRDAVVAARGRTTLERWLDAVIERRVEIELADAAGTLETGVSPAAVVGPQGQPEAPCVLVLHAGAVEAMTSLAARLAGAKGKVARDAADDLAAALDVPDAPGRWAAVRRALLTAKGEPRKAVVDAGGASAAEVFALIDRIATAQAQHEAQQEHLRMVRLARALLVTYRDYKRQRGLADLNDLERAALVLLRDSARSGWMQERLDLRTRQVLIDEFQDTNPVQWHAIRAWLDGYAGAGGGASGGQPPGVFIVGDPKQSIYRFRRAEPRVFEAAADFVSRSLGGHRLSCDHTRRNVPGVLDAVNAVFTRLQDQGLFSGFRPHTTSVAAPDALVAATGHLGRVPRPTGVEAPEDAPARDEPGLAGGVGVVFRDSLVDARDAQEEHRRREESDRVAGAIAASIAPPGGGGRRPGDILVLARTRAPLLHVAAALRERGVPHAPADELVLSASPEVQDLLAVLDVLASPGQDLSLARALRSPLFGIDDDELQQVALPVIEGRVATWWASLASLERPTPALRRAAQLLAGWQRAAADLPPHDLLERIVTEGDLLERLAVAVPASQRATALAAVRALIETSLRLDGARYATPYGFVRALRRQAVSVPAPWVADAVRLMTVHGAKGLEAEVVFVVDADPAAPPADGPGVLVEWPVESAAPTRCAFVSAASRVPPELRGLHEAEIEARGREELNGLYVAMTRAKQRLVFSATEPRTPAAVRWWTLVEPVCSPWSDAGGAEAPAGPEPGLSASATGAQASSPGPASNGAGSWRLPAFDWPSRSSTSPGPESTTAHRRGAAMADPVDDALQRDPARRLGLAVHRALEGWFAPVRREVDPGVPEPFVSLVERAAREFGADAAAVGSIVERILSRPEPRAFFDRASLLWSGNEVVVPVDGEVGRIDRLVLRAGEGAEPPTWWVLDYKLDPDPLRQPAYVEQMRAYRRAVQALQPGEPVRTAFITADGSVIEVR